MFCLHARTVFVGKKINAEKFSSDDGTGVPVISPTGPSVQDKTRLMLFQ